MTTIVLTILALLLSSLGAYLAVTQTAQLRRLRTISEDTHSIAEQIKSDKKTREAVTKLFGLTSLRTQTYHCFFPAEFRRKPLPLINAGDYRGLQVLNTRLTSRLLTLHALTRHSNPDHTKLRGNLIFLCAPSANAELKRRYPVVEIYDSIENAIDSSQALKKLPCWFAADFRADQKKHRDTRAEPIAGIVIRDSKQNLTSEAEDAYIAATKLNNDEAFDEFYDETRTFADRGIFARITDGTDRHFVIAGIHQFGTWIVAEFLDNLLSGQVNAFHESKFLGDEDFIAIIEGHFSCYKLDVEEAKVDLNGFWKREATGEWAPVRERRIAASPVSVL